VVQTTANTALLQSTYTDALGEHVRKVHSFAKQISGTGCLWRCNAQALRQDTGEIRQARAVPEVLTVGQEVVLGALGLLSISKHREQIDAMSKSVSQSVSQSVSEPDEPFDFVDLLYD
jgi:hypothetical protein